MMQLPSIETFSELPWKDIQPFVEELQECELTPATIDGWLRDWSRLQSLLHEVGARRRVATVRDTGDAGAEAALKDYLSEIYPPAQKARQVLTLKLLAYADEYGPPPGLETPLRGMRVQVELFREANLPLQTAEQEIGMRFNRLTSVQTVEWDHEEQTITRLASTYTAASREQRREMWDLVTAREMADRPAINELWTEVLDLRLKEAANAGYGSDYRAYRWQLLNRFDYSPDDAKSFLAAIEEKVVPAAGRVYEKYKGEFGVAAIRPWDLDLYQQTYPINVKEFVAFSDEEELLEKGSVVFHQVDPEIGAYFDRLRAGRMIDFANRKGKGPGAFCTSFEASRTPFIFGNVVGKDDDVRTLLHESGHAFHAFETFRLPYYQQRWAPMEFNEVASTAMELLASPYLGKDSGGYFEPGLAAQSRIRHLEKLLLFWPYMAVVDSFQHWVYENPGQARETASCDAAWNERWDRYIPWIDWSGVEEAKLLGWHRKRHIHRSPFYYIEYGLAQLGAVQIWANALENQAEAVRSYRNALALGGTVPLPELYAAAGGKFAFDSETIGRAVDLIEHVLEDLEQTAEAMH